MVDTRNLVRPLLTLLLSLKKIDLDTPAGKEFVEAFNKGYTAGLNGEKRPKRIGNEDNMSTIIGYQGGQEDRHESLRGSGPTQDQQIVNVEPDTEETLAPDTDIIESEPVTAETDTIPGQANLFGEEPVQTEQAPINEPTKENKYLLKKPVKEETKP